MLRAATVTAFLSFGLLVLGCSSDPAAAGPVAGEATVAPSGDAGTEPTNETDPACTAFEADLQKRVDDARAKKKWAHAALAVKTPRCGKTVVFSDDPKKDKAAADSLWRIGSVTKTFVAAAMLNVAASGQLSIDSALSEFLPDYPNAENIKLRHLLTHSSGVPDFFHVGAYVKAFERDPSRAITFDELLDLVKAEPAEFAPGKGWAYSNTNYALLGRVLEQVTGAPLAKVLREHAIARAGLAHTFFAGAEPTSGGFVSGFEDGVEWTNKAHPSWYGAAGAIAATPADLVEWTEKLYGSNEVIDEASRGQMLTTIPTNSSRIRYGLGVMEVREGGGVAFGHSGGVFGYRTETRYFPERKVAASALVADSHGDPIPLYNGALDALKILGL